MFFHGVQVTEVNNGGVVVTVVNSAVIGLVGSAPVFLEPGIQPPWNPKASYAIGAQVLDSNMNVQQATTVGISGTVTPAWGTTIGADTVDNTETWVLVKLANQQPTGVGSLNAPILVGSQNQASNFGALCQGYSIPYALNQIQQQPATGQVIVVNVFNPFVSNTAVVAEAFTFPATGQQVINLGHMGVLDVVLTNTGGSTTYTANLDYSIDWVNGLIFALAGGALVAAQAVKVSFLYSDPTQVSAAETIGTITAGVYSGMQCFLECFQQFGFFPKILIAPAISSTQTVAQALDVISSKIGAVEVIDSAPGTALATAVSNRSLTTAAFFTASYRAILAFPNQEVVDQGIVPTGVTLSNIGLPQQNTFASIQAALGHSQTSDMPYSPFVAGTIAATDILHGYWWSPSNKTFNGSQGPDISMYASNTDPNSDTNTLNAAGILTTFNGFGTGLRTWGNRSAAFPANADPATFIPIRRTLDVVELSMQLASLPFQDQPIDNGFIAAVLKSGNNFIRSLVQRGALLTGSQVAYFPADNPVSQLAQGIIVFEFSIMPPPPAEKIVYNFTLNTSLLASLVGPQQQAATQVIGA